MSLADTHRHSLWSAVMCQDGHQHSRGCSGYRPRLSARMPTQTAQCLVLGEEAWLFWHPTPPRVIWLLLCCLQGLCGGRCTASVCFCQEKITPKLSCWVPTWPSGLTQQNWWVPSDNPLRHSERLRGINSLQGRGVAPSEEDMQKSPHQSAREAVCFWAALSGSPWHLHRPGVDKIAATPENRTQLLPVTCLSCSSSTQHDGLKAESPRSHSSSWKLRDTLSFCWSKRKVRLYSQLVYFGAILRLFHLTLRNLPTFFNSRWEGLLCSKWPHYRYPVMTSCSSNSRKKLINLSFRSSLRFTAHALASLLETADAFNVNINHWNSRRSRTDLPWM